MKFECDSCHAQYMIADEKVGKRGVKVKCKKCQHVIIVRPAGQKEAVAAAPSSPVADLPKLEPQNAVAPKMEAPDAKKKEKMGERSSSKSAVKKSAKEKAAVSAIAPPPPPGPATLGVPRADDDDAGAFAATDLRGNFLDDGRPPNAKGVPPPPPLSGDGEPETTGPNAQRPAPISMFQDQTQLTANPMGDMVSEPAGKKLDDRTELGAPANMLTDANANRGSDNPADAATQVTTRPFKHDLDDVPAPPPAPPTMGMAAATTERVPSMGNPDDALGDQLDGAFNAMFDAAPAGGAASAEGDDHRDPTRVLDASAVDALRKQSGLPGGLPAGIKVDDTIRGDDHGLSDEGFVMKPAAGADDGPPDQVWHVAIDDQDVGPLSLAEVGRHIEGGRVDRESLVWKIGMDDWLPAGDVPAVRALFDKVPMPRIARVDDEQQSKNGSGGAGGGKNQDLGLPSLDGAPTGGSPFDESGEESWRPHGLTDVYQAANLAEAAGAGMGGSLGAAFGMSASASGSASSSSKSPSSGLGALGGLSSSEPEWRPGAASALSALVNDEIKRIDNGPPPASDDGLAPADDASIDAPIFGSMGSASARAGELDAGPELSDTVSPPRVAGAAFNGAAAPSFSRSPQGGFISTPPQQQQRFSPALIAGIAGGGALFLVLLILVVVLATRGGKEEPETKIVMIEGKPYLQGADGKFTPLTGDKDDKRDAKESKDASAAKDGTLNASVTTTPPTDGTNANANANPSANAGTPTGSSPPAGTDDTKPELALHTASPAAGDAKKFVKPRERDAPPKREEKPPPPPKSDKPARVGDCDPVLDFDCKAGKPAGGAPKTAEAVKDSLSKADVLVVVKANMGKVEGCGRKNKVGGVIKMSWKIQPSGKVSDVQVADSKFAGTPVGSCVTSEIKSWKFPASRASTPVSFPMKLGS